MQEEIICQVKKGGHTFQPFMFVSDIQTRTDIEPIQHGCEYCKILVIRMDVNVRIRRKS